jgi:hypothetical protein
MVLPVFPVARNLARAWLLALILGAVLTGPVAASEIYRYTDDAGTVHFTDDPGQIPEPIRTRMGIRIDRPAATPQPSRSPGPSVADLPLSQDPVKPTTATPSLWEPVPATMRSPWVPGLIGLFAAGGLLLGLRASKRPVPRVVCKGAIALVIAVSAVATVMASLAERSSSLPSVIGQVETAVDRWKSRVESPFKDADRRAKELGKAKREYQEMINQLGSSPQHPTP